MILNSLHRTSRWLMLLLFCLSLFAPIWLVLNPQPVEASLTFTYLGQVGTTGDSDLPNHSDLNKFRFPNGLAVNANNLFVADYFSVRKFSLSFTPTSNPCSSPSLSATFSARYGNASFGSRPPGPMGMTLSGGVLYLADEHYKRIEKLDLTNLSSLGNFGGGYFNSGIIYDIVEYAGEFYVTDYYDKINVFDSSGNYLRTYSGYGSNLRDIAVDSVGNLYVADVLNDRIMVLNRNRAPPEVAMASLIILLA